MLGDIWDADVTGAHNCGMDQMWFNRDNEKEREFSPTYTVYSLAEVRNIL